MFDRLGLARTIAAHGPVARVVVAEVQGSAPRDVGAAMLVWAGGQDGTIGGGALEHQAVMAARQALAQGTTRRWDSFSLGPDLGQCCGGAVRLLTEVFAQSPQDGAGYGRPVREQAGAMPLAIARALAQGRQGQPTRAALHQGWFFEPFAAQQTPVWIWGAGHVGRALVQVMAPLPNMAITWADTDLARYPAEIPLGVSVLPAPDLPRAVALAPQGAQHVIVTFSHAIDLALCDGLLRHGFDHCGLIGSASKWARFRSRLAALGHSPAEIARITCPIGAPEFGKHPQAIAIGVACAMMAANAATLATGAQLQRKAKT